MNMASTLFFLFSPLHAKKCIKKTKKVKLYTHLLQLQWAWSWWGVFRCAFREAEEYYLIGEVVFMGKICGSIIAADAEVGG
jgi:hypothetical protein